MSNTATIVRYKRPHRTPHLVSTEADRAAVLGAFRGLFNPIGLQGLANRTGLNLDRTADALHDLEALGTIRREGDGFAGPGMSRA